MRTPAILASCRSAVARQGLIAAVFSILTLVRPGRSLRSVVALCVSFALVDGVVAIACTARAALQRDRWLVLALEGVAGVSPVFVMGIWPDVGLLSLLCMVAGWTTVAGLATILNTPILEHQATREWLLAAAGVGVMRFGVVFLGGARCEIFEIALWAGTNACIYLIALMALGLHVRSRQTAAGSMDPAAFRRV